MSLLRSSKEFKEIYNSIKTTVIENGYITIEEFKAMEGAAGALPLLAALQEEGIVHVKSDTMAEVLVDIRLMVAGMLIAYSHPTYAKTNLVLDYLRHVFNNVYPGTNHRIIIERSNLLDRAYRQVGHNYTLSKVAERSVINNIASESNAYDLFDRSVSVLKVLSRNDSDLTAVYRLAKVSFDYANGLANGNVHGLHRKNQEPNSTFNHFHQLASKMINKHRPRK